MLVHLADGLTDRETGRTLFISPITDRNHVSNILAKPRSRTDARQ